MKIWSVVFLLVLAVPWAYASGEVAADAGNGYIGAEACLECHDDMAARFSKTLHARAFSGDSRHHENQCETCHGPGEAHEDHPSDDNIVTFGKDAVSSLKERNRQCLNCHGGEKELALWNTSLHARREMACDTCHTAHQGYSPINKSAESCYACHPNIRIDVRKQSRHPIREGKVTCQDCHNPHGTMSDDMLTADSLNDLCYRCHAEKRGPFMWEHSPVEENCGTCHTPHGSRHKKLLVQRGPTLCQNCHMGGHTSSRAWDQNAGFTGSRPSNRYYARNCMNCHSNVHGSMAPNSRGKRLIN